MSPKRNLENGTRADARKVDLHNLNSRGLFQWTPALWLHLIEAVEQFDKANSTIWEVVAETLPPDFMKTFPSVALAANSAKVHFENFRWQVKNPRKKARYATGVTVKVIQRMKDYLRSRMNKSPPNPTRKSNRQKAAQTLHEVKSDGPYHSFRRDKVDRVVDSDAFETFSTMSGTAQEMSVDQQEGFPAEVEENNQNVADDPSDFESFFGQYDLVANEIFSPINIQNFIQNGKNKARERMKQELGTQRFKALLQPSSWSNSQALIEASFSRFQTGIVRAVESCTDTLIDRVIKEVVIRELRKEE